jgi:hypothetical protein
VRSSQRLERERQRNLELLCLGGKLYSGFKTIANSRKDNEPALNRVLATFQVWCEVEELFGKRACGGGWRQVQRQTAWLINMRRSDCKPGAKSPKTQRSQIATASTRLVIAKSVL